MLRTAMAGLMLACLTAAAPPRPPYAEGQVWEYHTRPGDEGSLLRIQKIENLEGFGRVYHISIIGVHFAGLPLSGQLQHAPVSDQSLDVSVTRLSGSTTVFPDPAPGIAEWRQANGGVFTIPIAEVVGLVEQTVRAQTGQ
jgi:hypothetical protein